MAVSRFALRLLALAVAVQALVWGLAPASGGGALLPGLRPLFGLGYGVALLAAELLYCARRRLRRGAVVVLVAAAVVDVVCWGARLAGVRVPVGDAASLTAGFGALSLVGGLSLGWLGEGNRKLEREPLGLWRGRAPIGAPRPRNESIRGR